MICHCDGPPHEYSRSWCGNGRFLASENYPKTVRTRRYPSIKACNRPPDGWVCTRGRDHEGPCAAWPITE